VKTTVIILRYYVFCLMGRIDVENRPNVLLSEWGKFEYNRPERWS